MQPASFLTTYVSHRHLTRTDAASIRHFPREQLPGHEGIRCTRQTISHSWFRYPPSLQTGYPQQQRGNEFLESAIALLIIDRQ